MASNGPNLNGSGSNAPEAHAPSGDATRAWADMQQQMWDSWMSLMKAAPTLDPAVAEQWQALAEQSMAAWMSGAEPLAQATAAQVLAGQKAMFNLFDQFAQGWQQMGDAGAWQAAYADWVAQLQRQMTADPGNLFNMASTGMTNMMGAWPNMPQNPYAAFGMTPETNPYLRAWQDAMGQFMPGTDGAGNFGAMLMGGDLVNRTFNAYQQTVGQFLDSPPLGYFREYDERIRQLAKAYGDYQQVSNEYHMLVAEAWLIAMTKFQEALDERSRTGDPITSLQELADAWFAIADPAFSEIFVEERFIRGQGKLLSATMELRLKQREIVEVISRSLDIPTRTEVDQVHKTIYNQRKELKALKKLLTEAQTEIAALRAGVDEVATAAAGAPAKATAGKSSTRKSTEKKATEKKATVKTSTSSKSRKSAKKDES